MFLFLSFFLNRTILGNFAPALLSNLSVPLKPEGLFVCLFVLIRKVVHTHGKRK